MTVGDVLATFQAGRPTQLGSNSIEDPLREDLVAGLAADRWIRLGQAGGPGDAKLHLDDVAVDVPATVTESTLGTGAGLDAHVLERGDAVLSVRQPQHAGLPGVVLVGGPGRARAP